MDESEIHENISENEKKENDKLDDQTVLPSKSTTNSSSETESSEDASFKEFHIDDKLEERLKKKGLNRRNVKTIIRELLNDSNVLGLLRSNVDDSVSKFNFPEEKNLRSKVVKPASNSPPTFTEIALPDEDDEDEDFKPGPEDIIALNSEDTTSALDTTTESQEGSPKKDETVEAKSSFYSDLQQCEDEIKALNDNAKNYSDIVDDELIALRTRSKQSLHDTNLIELETAFNPPDVTDDMYLPSGDSDWHKWLAELMIDAPDTVQSGMEDDDTVEDPDYNFIASESEEHIDKDDFRDDPAVHISRKEVQELLSQIEDMDDIDCRGDSLYEPIPKPPNLQPKQLMVKDMITINLQHKKSSSTTEEAEQPTEEEKSIEFTREQHQILETQMRQHIQLLTQVNLISRNNPKLLSVVQDTHSLLQELKQLGEQGVLVFKTASKFNAPGLEGAIDIVVSNVKKSEPVLKQSRYERTRRVAPISMNVAKIIANSPVFSYVELLPVCSGTISVKEKRTIFLESDDNLLVLGWIQMQNQFSPCPNLIHQYMLPTKTPEQIKSRLLNSKNGHVGPHNPIFIYKQSGLLPRLPKAMKPAVGHGTKVKNLLELKHHWKPEWLLALQELIYPQAVSHNPFQTNKQITEERNEKVVVTTKQRNNDPVKFFRVGSYNVPITPSLKFPLIKKKASPQISSVIILPSVVPVSRQFMVGSTGQLQFSPSKIALPKTTESRPKQRKSLFNSVKRGKVQSKPALKYVPSTKQSTNVTESKTRKTTSDTAPPISKPQHTQNNTKDKVVSDKLDGDGSSDESGVNEMECEDDCNSTTKKSGDKQVENANKNCAKQHIIASQEKSNPSKNTTTSNCAIDNSKTVGKGESSVSSNNSILKRKKKQSIAYLRNTSKRPKINRSERNSPEKYSTSINKTNLKRIIPQVDSSHKNDKEHSMPEKNQSPLLSDPEAVHGDSEADELTDVDDGKLFAKKNLKSQKKWKHKLKVKWRKKEEHSTKKSGRLLHSLIGKSGGRSKDEDDLSKSLKESAEKVKMLEEDTIVQLDPMRVEKELLFAQGYLKRMEEALKDHPDVLINVLEVLCEFDQNSSQSPPMLFNKLSQILEKWPDLLQGFAPFLMPEQAHACGLFPQQQVYARARKFLRQLEIRFQGNPSHLNKILSAFRTVAESGIYVEKEIKATILTLLKAEPFLQEQFLMFFDNEQPPESRLVGDYEEIVWNDDLLKETATTSHENVYVPISEENVVNEAGHPEVTSKSPPAKSVAKKLNEFDKVNEEIPLLDKEMDDADDLEIGDGGKTEDESEEDSDGIDDTRNELRDISSQEILSPNIGIVTEDALSCSPFKKFTPLGGAKLVERNKNDDKQDTNSIPRPFTPVESQESQDSLSLPSISKKLEQSPASSVGSNLPLTPTSSSKNEVAQMIHPPISYKNKTSDLEEKTKTLVSRNIGEMKSQETIENKIQKTPTKTDILSTNEKADDRLNTEDICQENVIKTSNPETIIISEPPIDNFIPNESSRIQRIAGTKSNDDLEFKGIESGNDKDIIEKSSENTDESSNEESSNDESVNGDGNVALTDGVDGVFKWTREEDGLLLMICRENGSTQTTFEKVGEMVQRSPKEVLDRLNQLMALINGANAESDTTSQTSDTDDSNDEYDSQSD